MQLGTGAPWLITHAEAAPEWPTVSVHRPPLSETDISGWHTQSHRPSVGVHLAEAFTWEPHIHLGNNQVFDWIQLFLLLSLLCPSPSTEGVRHGCSSCKAQVCTHAHTLRHAHSHTQSHKESSLWGWLYSFHWWFPLLSVRDFITVFPCHPYGFRIIIYLHPVSGYVFHL